jgi:hypothetical protein
LLWICSTDHESTTSERLRLHHCHSSSPGHSFAGNGGGAWSRKHDSRHAGAAAELLPDHELGAVIEIPDQATGVVLVDGLQRRIRRIGQRQPQTDAPPNLDRSTGDGGGGKVERVGGEERIDEGDMEFFFLPRAGEGRSL